MRIYYEGKPVDMKDITWKLLCSAKTYVDFNKDTNIKFPDHVIQQREKAIKKLTTILIPKNKRIY